MPLKLCLRLGDWIYTTYWASNWLLSKLKLHHSTIKMAVSQPALASSGNWRDGIFIPPHEHVGPNLMLAHPQVFLYTNTYNQLQLHEDPWAGAIIFNIQIFQCHLLSSSGTTQELDYWALPNTLSNRLYDHIVWWSKQIQCVKWVLTTDLSLGLLPNWKYVSEHLPLWCSLMLHLHKHKIGATEKATSHSATEGVEACRVACIWNICFNC